METLNSVLPIIVYILLIVLIIVAIVLGIKFILTLNKVDKVVDNVETKVNSLNDLFDVVSTTTSRFGFVYNRISDFCTDIIQRVFKKKDKDLDDVEEGDESEDE